MLYQSMSGDASEGIATFNASNSNLTIQKILIIIHQHHIDFNGPYDIPVFGKNKKMQKCDKIHLKPCKSVIKTFKMLAKM